MFPSHIAISGCAILCLVTFSTVSFADGTAQRFPTNRNYDDSSHEIASSHHGIVDLNPTGSMVLDQWGSSTRSQAYVDSDHGIVKGYVGVNVITDIPFSSQDPMTYASGSGSGSGYLVGPGTEPIHMSARWTFDGSFSGITGAPFLQLIAGATVGVTNFDLTDTYQSFLNFSTNDGGKTVGIDKIATKETTIGGVVGPKVDYAGAMPAIESSAASHLSGTASISFDAIPGTFISVVADLTGHANGEIGAYSFLPSSGAVDFLHTGKLQIFLPNGYSFSGSDTLLNNVITNVPEPETYAMLIAGLGLLGWRLRREIVKSPP